MARGVVPSEAMTELIKVLYFDNLRASQFPSSDRIAERRLGGGVSEHWQKTAVEDGESNGKNTLATRSWCTMIDF